MTESLANLPRCGLCDEPVRQFDIIHKQRPTSIRSAMQNYPRNRKKPTLSRPLKCECNRKANGKHGIGGSCATCYNRNYARMRREQGY
jgi:hypothetical protein